MQAIRSAVKGINNGAKIQNIIRTGKVELINPTYRTPVARDNYYTFAYNGKEKLIVRALRSK